MVGDQYKINFSLKTKSTSIKFSEINTLCTTFKMSLSLHFCMDRHTARWASEHGQFRNFFFKFHVFIVLKLPASLLTYFSSALTVNNINKVCTYIVSTKVSIAVKKMCKNCSKTPLCFPAKPILKHTSNRRRKRASFSITCNHFPALHILLYFCKFFSQRRFLSPPRCSNSCKRQKINFPAKSRLGELLKWGCDQPWIFIV